MEKVSLTIFTPTYNRAYILPKLKNSLCQQDRYDFEWLVLDDGSTDNTELLFKEWQKEQLPFPLNYIRIPNGGKPRAINKACQLANSDWMFIIDSDDTLVENTIGFILNAIDDIKNDNTFVGIGVLRGHRIDKPFGTVNFKDYVDCTNLDRAKNGLNFDCNEAYRVETLKNFPFEVWEGEKFVPEEVVLNEMSLQGFRLRWYNKVGVISEYLDDGLTKGAWGLIKKNPMGYAMLYNHKLKFTQSISSRILYVCQFIALCLYAGNYKYLRYCHSKLVFPLLPIGYLLSLRRKKQFKEL